jgi:hypothetical protein
MSQHRGDKHHRRRLSEADVRGIRQLHTKGVCCACIVKVLDLTVAQATVRDAANYRTWTHVR